MLRRLSLTMMCVVAGALLAASASQAAYITERVNLNRLGLQSNGGSWAPSMSADGRFVAFHSWATDLIVGDKDGRYDIYLRDRLLGINYLISGTSDGLLENGESLYPYISADGMSVAFNSEASNLVPGDTNGVIDVFVRDWMAGVIERVSVATSGEEANGPSGWAVVSGDGRFVAFRSEATNLIPGGNPRMAVYLRDRLTHETECVSISSSGALASQNSSGPAITPDGRYVAFTSWAGNLVPGDKNSTADVFLRDRSAGTTERVSLATLTGQEGNGSSAGPRPAITPDGRFIAFSSLASNLVANDTNSNWDVFVRDRLTGVTDLVSVSSAGVQGNNKSGADSYELAISDDGRYVEFCSLASNLVPGDTNGQWDTFVRDRQTRTTERVSISTTGTQPNLAAGYYGLGMTSDGKLRIFDSHAHNLVPNDTSTCINTFLRRPLEPPVAAFSAAPTSGVAPLTVWFTDASTGNPTSCSWDFGDGASSSDSSPVHQYTEPGTFTVSLMATNADGSNTATKTAYINVTDTHNVAVKATASPVAIASGGTVGCSASATDSLGHTDLAWSWSDNGAGGVFSPSATVASSTYTAPANASGIARTIELTATATCALLTPAISSSATVPVTEESALLHALTVTTAANPSAVASGGTAALTALATDSWGDGIASWSWSDGGAGGVFIPSSSVQNPSYIAPANTTNKPKSITLGVTATCAGAAPISGSASTAVTVQPAPHTLTVSATASPTAIASGGTVKLSATAVDSLKHSGFTYAWSDNGAGGTFSSASVRNPTYTAPANTSGSQRTITLTIAVTCKWWAPWVSASTNVTITEASAPGP